MKQLRKRNNYTLSIEAQKIMDKVKNKSRFVSEAIIQKNNTDNFDSFLSGEVADAHLNAMKLDINQRTSLEVQKQIKMTQMTCLHELTAVPWHGGFHSDYIAECRKCGFRP